MNPDIVYVVGRDETNEELRYSLRSLRNLPHGTVWIAGYRPRWVQNVEHLPLRQDATKYQNSTANLLAASTHPDVSEVFYYFNDDFFVLRPTPDVPALHLGPIGDRVDYYDEKYGHRRNGAGAYRDGMVATSKLLASWGLTDLLCYEVHAPITVNKDGMFEVIRRAFAETSIVALHKRTLYGNVHRLGGEIAHSGGKLDVKVLTADHTWDDDQTFMSTSNQSWGSGRAGRRLRELFPEPSPYERG